MFCRTVSIETRESCDHFWHPPLSESSGWWLRTKIRDESLSTWELMYLQLFNQCHCNFVRVGECGCVLICCGGVKGAGLQELLIPLLFPAHSSSSPALSFSQTLFFFLPLSTRPTLQQHRLTRTYRAPQNERFHGRSQPAPPNLCFHLKPCEYKMIKYNTP